MTKTLSSPLVAAANNIVSMGVSSKKALPRFQSDYNNFINFLEIKKVELDRIRLPEKRKIKEIANLNVAPLFGTPGNLLGGLASGALDVAGFLGNMFPGRGKAGKPGAETKPPKPVTKGSKVGFSGVRSIGIVNALFAGLDFATGLQEGESVGKAAAGAGGSLAGSLLGGAIGQTLIPVPGLGFVLGSMAGSFIGGYAADRIVEATSGGGGDLKEKTEKRIKEQEQRQKSLVMGEGSFAETLNKFEVTISKFEGAISSGLFSMIESPPMEDVSGDITTDYTPPSDDSSVVPTSGETISAEGGDDPSKHFTSGFGWRWGRMHNGVDFAHPTQNAPISILQPGVADVGYERGYGNWVAVKHDNGAETFYGHLSKVSVARGQRIAAGTVIGNQGNTGRSYGAHVHFEYRPGGPGTNRVDGRSVAGQYFRYGGKVKVNKVQPTDSMYKMGDVSGTYPAQKTGREFFAAQNPIQGVSEELQPQRLYKDVKIQEMVKNQEKYKEGISGLEGDKKVVVEMMHKQYQDYLTQYNKDKKSVQVSADAKRENNIVPTKPREVPNVSYYPSYDNNIQDTVTIIPFIANSQQSQSPKKQGIIPIPINQSSGEVFIPPPSEGEIVNSLVKTLLLTNLSSS